MLIQSIVVTTIFAVSGWSKLVEQKRCDPALEGKKCPPALGFAGKAIFDFTRQEDDFDDFWSVNEDDTSSGSDENESLDFDTDGEGLGISVWEKGQAPTLTSNRYLFFGKVSVEMKAAEGNGLVTALVLMSDTGDEIDWELLGAYEHEAQSNYFHDGVALYNVYNNTYETSSSVFSSFNLYTVEWLPEKLVFYINNEMQKTWYMGDIPGEKWPGKPMRIKIGVWSVDDTSDKGTIAWAGGEPSWDEGSSSRAFVRRLEVEDYMGMCEDGGGSQMQYLVNDRTARWNDVEVGGCEKRDVGDPGNVPSVSDDPYPPPLVSSSSSEAGYPAPPGPATTVTTAWPSTAEITGGPTAGDATGTGTGTTQVPEQTGDKQGEADKRRMPAMAALVVAICWALTL